MPPMKLPPGATLVDDGSGNGGMKLPPGATLVTGNSTPPAPQPGPEPGFLQRGINEFKDAFSSPSNYVAAVKKNIDVSKEFAGTLAKDIGNVLTSPGTYAGPIMGRAPEMFSRLSDTMQGKGADEEQPLLHRIGSALGVDTRAVENDSAQGKYGATIAHAGVPLALLFGGAAAGERPGAPSLWDTTKANIRQQIAPGSAADLLVRATKPNVGLSDYEGSLNRAIPALATAKPQSLSGLASAADQLAAAKNADFVGLRDQVKQPIDLSGAADLQDKSLPVRRRFEDVTGNAQRALTDKAAAYRRSVPIQEADDLRIGTNAELRNFFNQAKGDQQAALQNPETARIFAANKGVRDAEYSAIKDATGVDPQPIQNLYGDLVDIGDTAARRNTIFSRQQPLTLQEQISTAQALGEGKPLQAVIARVFKKVNDSDWLTKEAFRRYEMSQAPARRPSYGAFAAAINSR